MKKFLFALLLPLLSAALFAQQEGEVFDLSDDITTENEENFWDFYNNHWQDEKTSVKRMIVEFLNIFENVKEMDTDAEEVIVILQEIVYGDEFEALIEIWEEGAIPTFSTMAALCNICLFAEQNLTDEMIVQGYKIIRKYCDEEISFPNAFLTSDYKKIY